eukprot:m.108036 g.108036  ORF g.108036 m.108036 type:complete len:196 (-) comp9184_c6_seq1:301-888(-)
MSHQWEVELADGKHTITFMHGTTSGKRVINVDGDELLRRNWMFKLVGEEFFNIGTKKDHEGCISISTDGLKYKYSLFIDGKPLQEFTSEWKKSMKSWHFETSGELHLVVLDMDTMKIFIDGEMTNAEGDFVEDGTETHFSVGSHPAYILTTPSSDSNTMEHILFVNDEEVLPSSEDRATKPGSSKVKWTGHSQVQ